MLVCTVWYTVVCSSAVEIISCEPRRMTGTTHKRVLAEKITLSFRVWYSNAQPRSAEGRRPRFVAYFE